MRIPQPEGTKGSLKWIQRLVASGEKGWLPQGLREVEWVSPLLHDEWAEYRDGSFLSRVGQAKLKDDLKCFWPARGPQWDALGIIDGLPVLVEAKAHVREFFSPATQAGQASRSKIEAAFAAAAPDFGSTQAALWSE